MCLCVDEVVKPNSTMSKTAGVPDPSFGLSNNVETMLEVSKNSFISDFKEAVRNSTGEK